VACETIRLSIQPRAKVSEEVNRRCRPRKSGTRRYIFQPPHRSKRHRPSQGALGATTPSPSKNPRLADHLPPKTRFLALTACKMQIIFPGLCQRRTLLGSLQRSPDPLAGGDGARCPLSKNPSPLSAFGIEFRPFGPEE